MLTYNYFILSQSTRLTDRQTGGQTDRQMSTARVCSNRVRCALKRYRTAADRLSDFKLGTADEIKADREGLRGVRLPQVAMHRNCTLSSCYYEAAQS